VGFWSGLVAAQEFWVIGSTWVLLIATYMKLIIQDAKKSGNIVPIIGG
jgi:hypothetical protein